MFTFLSQRDARWSRANIGPSPLTIGRWGCTTTCISMLCSAIGTRVLPNEIASHLDWYTQDGLILWKRLKLPISFEKRIGDKNHFVRNDAEIMESIKNPKKAVILQVDNGQHWVVALRKSLVSNDYVIADPWLGNKQMAFGLYKNITGSAHFLLK